MRTVKISVILAGHSVAQSCTIARLLGRQVRYLADGRVRRRCPGGRLRRWQVLLEGARQHMRVHKTLPHLKLQAPRLQLKMQTLTMAWLTASLLLLGTPSHYAACLRGYCGGSCVTSPTAECCVSALAANCVAGKLCPKARADACTVTAACLS